MDPLSHAVTGGALAGMVARRPEIRAAIVVGTLAGMAPDLDILIRSAEDPLLNLQFHRHFTHALLFTPVGAGICALLGYPLFRRWLSFWRLYLFAALGYVQGGLLDAATSYGTHLWWPLTETRTAWNLISIIDPFYTLPVLVLVALGWANRSRRWAILGVGWALIYLAVGLVQRERAESHAESMAWERGHSPERLEVKPSALSNQLFRSTYLYEGRIYVDAVRVPWFGRGSRHPGDSVPRLKVERDFPGLPEESRARQDIERFRFFSDDWLYLDPHDPDVISDGRYAMIPNAIDPLWGIRTSRHNPDQAVEFETYRRTDPETRQQFFSLLFGRVSEDPESK